MVFIIRVLYTITINKIVLYYANTVETVSGEELEILRVSREHMGAYLCIAKNPVPPPVSKRIMLQVHCEYYIISTYVTHMQFLFSKGCQI